MRFEIRYWDELVPAEELLVSFAAEAAPPDEPTAAAASPASDGGSATSALCAQDLALSPLRRGAAVTAP